MQRNNRLGTNPTGACASCRHQRKKCTEKCTLAPFFPVEKNREFLAVHKIFGVSNVTKMLNRLNIENRKGAVDSLIWEAFSREKDPIFGPFGEYRRVVEELKWYKKELEACKSSLTTSGLINEWNGVVANTGSPMLNDPKYNVMNNNGNAIYGLYPNCRYYSHIQNTKLSEESENSSVIISQQPVLQNGNINQHYYQLAGQYGAIDQKQLEWDGNS